VRGKFLHDQGCCTPVEGVTEEIMPIGALPPHSHKQRAWNHLAGIGHNLLDGTVRRTEEDASR
jgi:hypothetical protein